MAIPHKILFTSIFILIVASTLTVLLFSFTQVTDKETTGNGSTQSYGNKFCESKIAYLPSKFAFKNDTGHVITCKWETKNSTVRILLALAVISSIVIFVLACLTVYSAYLDTTAVKSSRSWCEDDGPGMATGQGLICQYNNYILVIGLNIIAIILMIAAPIIVIKYRNHIEGHHHHHHHHDDPSESETTPLVNDQQQSQPPQPTFQQHQQQNSNPFLQNDTPPPPSVSLNPFL